MSDSNQFEIDRRAHFRLDMEKEFIDIAWTDDAGNARVKRVACLDFSQGGLRVDSDMPLPEKLEVSVIFKPSTPYEQVLKGQVYRCMEQPTGWYEVAFIMATQKKNRKPTQPE